MQIKKTCPWYWVFTPFILEHPNLVPAGIGNNTTKYDVTLLVPHVEPVNSELEVTEDTDGDQIDGLQWDVSDAEVDQLEGDGDELPEPNSLLGSHQDASEFMDHISVDEDALKKPKQNQNRHEIGRPLK